MPAQHCPTNTYPNLETSSTPTIPLTKARRLNLSHRSTSTPCFQSLEFPRGGKNVFKDCAKLASTSMVSFAGNISEGCFCNCHKMPDADLAQVTSIGAYAFFNCSFAVSIVLNASLTYVGDFAFAKCASIMSISSLSQLPNTFHGGKVTTRL